MLRLHTVSGEEKDFDVLVNRYLAYADRQGFTVKDIDFKILVRQDKKVARTHYVAFIKYEENKIS